MIHINSGSGKRKLVKVRGFWIAMLFDVSCGFHLELKLFLAGIKKYTFGSAGTNKYTL